MSGRVYTVVFKDVAVTAAQDLFELTPASNHPIAITQLHISQTSELGDAAEEQLNISIIRGHTTSGSGGTAPTPAAISPSDAAASTTAEVNNTTIASTGTTTTLHVEAFNIRAGYSFVWPPENAPEANSGNTTIVVRLTSTPADSITLSGTLYFMEF